MDHCRSAIDLRRADVGRGVNYLPLQVRERDHVVVDNTESTDPGGGKIEQNRSAEPTGADHQYARAAECGLPGPANIGQYDVARVAFELFGAEHSGTKHNVKIGLNRPRDHR